jgi:COP9 signalosome complex subunit 7
MTLATPNLPTLSPAQRKKLLLLSLLPLAQSQSTLSYANLQTALSIPSQKDLESLITTAIYSGLVTGTLDPHTKLACISSVAPLRDLPPGSVPTLNRTLAAWSAQCSETLRDLEEQIREVSERAREEGERTERVKKMVDERIEAEEKGGKGKRSAGAVDPMLEVDEGIAGESMEVDGMATRSKSAKRSGFWR